MAQDYSVFYNYYIYEILIHHFDDFEISFDIESSIKIENNIIMINDNYTWTQHSILFIFYLIFFFSSCEVPQENVPPEKEREIISSMLRAMEDAAG